MRQRTPPPHHHKKKKYVDKHVKLWLIYNVNIYIVARNMNRIGKTCLRPLLTNLQVKLSFCVQSPRVFSMHIKLICDWNVYPWWNQEWKYHHRLRDAIYPKMMSASYEWPIKYTVRRHISLMCMENTRGAFVCKATWFPTGSSLSSVLIHYAIICISMNNNEISRLL
jgi:hypothetical protein